MIRNIWFLFIDNILNNIRKKGRNYLDGFWNGIDIINTNTIDGFVKNVHSEVDNMD